MSELQHLTGKRILLGISGSISAYKSAFLCRLLIKAGAEVRAIMTASACEFVSPLTLSTLSKHEVYTSMFEGDTWHNHVELGLWADYFLIAPATAHTLAKCAAGMSDNILVTTYLSAKCPVAFAPAMDRDMYLHPSTDSNLETLRSYGNKIIGAEHGELASGLYGKGRMAEPEHICVTLNHLLKNNPKRDVEEQREEDLPLSVTTVLITAGPTYEFLDPVRFLGNPSTGTMGVALAEAAASQGAKVHLVLGPSQLDPRHPLIDVYRVTSTREMYERAEECFEKCHLAIFAAAVSDYKPATKAEEKIKKSDNDLELALVKTVDIAKTLSTKKESGQFTIGFALETENEESNAVGKLKKKNFDAIVMNSLRDEGAGFGTNTNVITIYGKEESPVRLPKKDKSLLAEDIISYYLKIRRNDS